MVKTLLLDDSQDETAAPDAQESPVTAVETEGGEPSAEVEAQAESTAEENASAPTEPQAAEDGAQAGTDAHVDGPAGQDGHDEPGHSEPGHEEPGHDEPGHTDPGHDEPGHVHGEGDAPGHDADEHHGSHSFLSPGHLMGHVQDSDKFEFSFWLTGRARNEGGTPIHIGVPQLPEGVAPAQPIVGTPTGILQPWDFKITKFMVLEVLVAVALVAVFVPLARRIRTGQPPKGRWWNLMETLIVYVRDQVARPSIGHHDADKFLPYLWTVFFFILFGNLCGLVPFLGSPTGALGTTVVLALATFLVVLATGIKKMGVIGFLKAQVPHMDLPWFMAIFIFPLIFVLEIAGLCIKHAVLSIRLFANMFAGHLVLAVLLAFVGETWASSIVYAVGPASIGAMVAVNLLELFVAFLQAYIFTFLSALFIGAAAHPH
ncbi:MAG: F0F1 ATP synthase subunit A [Pirellulaceae bacterium]